MKPQTKQKRRYSVILNYLCLVIMNICFYVVFHYKDMTHLVDFVGISAFMLVIATFIRLHIKSGLWKLTHTDSEVLDERELQVTHNALRYSYSWFTVICLAIMLVHAVFFRLFTNIDFIITIPLVSSLVYFAHTLPGSILAWTETKVPSDLS